MSIVIKRISAPEAVEEDPPGRCRVVAVTYEPQPPEHPTDCAGPDGGPYRAKDLANILELAKSNSVLMWGDRIDVRGTSGECSLIFDGKGLVACDYLDDDEYGEHPRQFAVWADFPFCRRGLDRPACIDGYMCHDDGCGTEINSYYFGCNAWFNHYPWRAELLRNVDRVYEQWAVADTVRHAKRESRRTLSGNPAVRVRSLEG